MRILCLPAPTHPCFELKVRIQIDHFNQRHWFEVNEQETGECLGEGNSFDQAYQLMRGIINSDVRTYFTSQAPHS